MGQVHEHATWAVGSPMRVLLTGASSGVVGTILRHHWGQQEGPPPYTLRLADLTEPSRLQPHEEIVYFDRPTVRGYVWAWTRSSTSLLTDAARVRRRGFPRLSAATKCHRAVPAAGGGRSNAERAACRVSELDLSMPSAGTSRCQ